MKGDLHVHTSISDSSYTTKETLEMAKENGVTHIGIVNHDTVKGLSEAIRLGEEIGIKVIPGIEISAYDFNNNRKVHILGYNFDLRGENIKKICDPLLKRRDENSKWQIKALIENGYDIDIEYIKEKGKESGITYKQHIMMALIKKDYTNKIYSNLYRELFKNNGICDKDIDYIDVLDAVEAIKKDGGIAVLAHPGQLNSYDIIPQLIEKGLDGIEMNHHSHNESDIHKIKEISSKYNIILTGGTDFHGKYSEKAMEIGEISCPQESIQKFLNI